MGVCVTTGSARRRVALFAALAAAGLWVSAPSPAAAEVIWRFGTESLTATPADTITISAVVSGPGQIGALVAGQSDSPPPDPFLAFSSSYSVSLNSIFLLVPIDLGPDEELLVDWAVLEPLGGEATPGIYAPSLPFFDFAMGPVAPTNSFTLTVVPEPATGSLLLAGVVVLGGWARYRRRGPGG